MLSVEGVSRRFGGLTAVNNLSLEVAPGELIAIVGPNGAGKSTFFQLVTGVERPDGGRIRLGDQGMGDRAPGDRTSANRAPAGREREITGLPPESIAALGVARTFQTSRVFPGLSIWESVRVGTQVQLIGGGRFGRRVDPFRETLLAFGRPKGYRRRLEELDRKAEGVLRLFGDRLWPRRFDPAQSLSYANRRRLEIARALVADPLLLLLDEPTAGMNSSETGELADLIARLHDERPEMSIVLVEHKLQVVRRLADRVLVMDQGSEVVTGSPHAVLDDPRVVDAYLGGRRDGGEAESAGPWTVRESV